MLGWLPNASGGMTVARTVPAGGQVVCVVGTGTVVVAMGVGVAVLPGVKVFPDVGVACFPEGDGAPQAARVSTRSKSTLMKATNRCPGKWLRVCMEGISSSFLTTHSTDGDTVR